MPDSAVPSGGDVEERFLRLVEEEQPEAACDLLLEYPTLAARSIHTAACVGDVQRVAELLASDRSLATRPSVHGSPPIVLAAHAGMQQALSRRFAGATPDGPDVVRLLLDAGENANAFKALGDDPALHLPVLYFACVSGNLPVARLLLERGAAPNDGESVYHAAERDHRDILALLLSHGADLSGAHAVWGNTPLYFLAGYGDGSPQGATVLAGMRWLLEHGADPNVPSFPDGREAGAARAGEMPLHRIATCRRAPDGARLLLDFGATVDAPRGDGRTPYALAVRAGHESIAALLHAHGADPGRLSTIDRLLGACMTGDRGAASALVAADPALLASLTGEDRGVLAVAAGAGEYGAVRTMLDLGWPVGDDPGFGTALHQAAWHGHEAIVDALVAAGAPLDARDHQYGSSPVAWAAHGSAHAGHGREAEYVRIVERLVGAGSRYEAAVNRWGEEPGWMASTQVREALLRLRFMRDAG